MAKPTRLSVLLTALLLAGELAFMHAARPGASQRLHRWPTGEGAPHVQEPAHPEALIGSLIALADIELDDAAAQALLPEFDRALAEAAHLLGTLAGTVETRKMKTYQSVAENLQQVRAHLAAGALDDMDIVHTMHASAFLRDAGDGLTDAPALAEQLAAFDRQMFDRAHAYIYYAVRHPRLDAVLHGAMAQNPTLALRAFIMGQRIVEGARAVFITAPENFTPALAFAVEELRWDTLGMVLEDPSSRAQLEQLRQRATEGAIAAYPFDDITARIAPASPCSYATEILVRRGENGWTADICRS